MDEHDGKVNVGVSAIVRITLKDGTFHEVNTVPNIGSRKKENREIRFNHISPSIIGYWIWINGK